jgi:AraC-like DNA-binding protein
MANTRNISMVVNRIPVQLLDVVHHIEENIDKPIHIEELSSLTSWGITHFSRIFKLFYHKTIYQYILEKKIEYAKEMLVNSDIYISELHFKCGFESYSNFFHAFKKFTTMTPQEYRFYYKPYLKKVK